MAPPDVTAVSAGADQTGAIGAGGVVGREDLAGRRIVIQCIDDVAGRGLAGGNLEDRLRVAGVAVVVGDRFVAGGNRRIVDKFDRNVVVVEPPSTAVNLIWAFDESVPGVVAVAWGPVR